ncbi:MAG: adenylate/guanylate cyclase domain-containing protein [Dehalococcoidia bacterium]|nr:adenylate/guanylate cyclase domain-containing protein [Dehalococcoidia bacterium]
MKAQRDARYCTTSDGVRIAYCVEGAGETSILALQAVYEAFSLDHLMPVYKQFYRDLGANRRVVRFDRRGSGLSEGESLFGGGTQDIHAVARAVGAEKYVVWASTTSGPAALRFVTRNPSMVSHLVLYGTYARLADALPATLLSGLDDLARADWQTANRTIADLNGRREFPEEAGQLGEWFARSTTPERFLQRGAADDEQVSEVSAILSRIQTPTLVLHRIADPSIPFAAGQKLAAGIPGARLVTLEGTGHLFCLGDYDPILKAVDSFLDDGQGRDSPGVDRSVDTTASSSGTAIILFADIADSTALTERLGDAAFREKARALDEALRQAITSNGGTAIEGKLLGDGVLATFGAAREAIACAGACHEASSPAGLPLHVGIHAGDVIREEGNVYGGAVNIAARVAELSAPEEVLVSQTVRDLARTSAGVSFEDRGERELKGVGEPVRVYAVRWNEKGST